jgi:subtilisin-like proprotein convertase family protein
MKHRSIARWFSPGWHNRKHAKKKTGAVARTRRARLQLDQLEDRVLLNGGPGKIQFSVDSFTSTAAATATIVATRTGGDDGAVSVTYSTSNGTAVSGSDYQPFIGTLSWADADQSTKTFSIKLLKPSTATETQKTLDVTLSDPTGGATLGAQSTAVVTISPDPQAPPPKVVSQQQVTQDSATLTGNEVAPSVAINPLNPQEIVNVTTFDDQNAPIQLDLLGTFSTDGGTTWQQYDMPAPLLNPTTNPLAPFAGALDASVAFDTSGHFYLLWKEQGSNTPGSGDTSGAIRVARFTFSNFLVNNFTPDVVSTVYEWANGGSNALDPTIAIDTNPATFTDPQTHVTQNDPYSGNVYVSFVLNTPSPGNIPPPLDWNPFTVWAAGSANMGVSWSNLNVIPNGRADPNIGTTSDHERDAAPRIAISSGTASGSIKPGTLTIVYEDNGPALNTPAPPPTGPFSEIKSVTVSNLPINELFAASAVGPITPGVAGGTVNQQFSASPGSFIQGGNPFGVTDSTINVAQGIFTTVTKVTVTLTINYGADGATHGDGDLNLLLIGPNGTTTTELSNRHGGFTLPGNFNGTTFDDTAATTIANGSPPYSGTFKPDGALAAFVGNNPSGNWTLEVQDFGSGTGTFVSWTLNITGNGPATAQTTSYQIPVSITDPRFVSATGMTVDLAIEEQNMRQLSAVLIPPASSGLQSIQLFNNGSNANGSTNTGSGLGGSNLGVLNTVVIGTVLSDTAALRARLNLATGPFIGYFRPEYNSLYNNNGTLSEVAGASAAQLDGTWTLQITDYLPEGATNPHKVDLLSISFVSGWSPAPPAAAVAVTSDNLIGGPNGVNVTKIPASPDVGVGPAPVIAYDNTLGSFSPFQGRLYMLYVDRVLTPAGSNPNPLDNTDIMLRFSDDGGQTWSAPKIVNDDSVADGFSGGDRAQFMPEVAVDQFTGSLVVSFFDARYDPSRGRVVNTITYSIDGGQTFSSQNGVYTNPTREATDTVTGQPHITAIPDNDTSQNGNKDTLLGFGQSQGLSVVDGHVFSFWSANLNGGTDPLNPLRNRMWEAQVEIPAGPRIIDSTMGPVQPVTINGQTFNASTMANGTPLLQGFAVQFDRPVDPGSFTASDVQVSYLSTVPGAVRVPVAIGTITPLDPTPLGATAFFVNFAAPQTATGTYSYAVGPFINDRIRSPISNAPGNNMDENANATAGEQATSSSGGDVYSAPTPVNNGPNFQAPFSQQTLPLVIPGPHIVSTSVPGVAASAANIVVNQPVNSIDVVFDRDIQASTFTPAAILRMVGPAGMVINGPFTITPNPNGTDPNPSFPRTFRIGFPSQNISGQYTLTLAPVIRAQNGDLLDTNENAGVDIVFDKPSGGTIPLTQANATPTPIPFGNTNSTITVNNPFVIQGVQVSLNISYPNDQDLTATLIAPDGTKVLLFQNLANSSSTQGFANTVLTDSATTPDGQPNPITQGVPPFNGTFNPQQPLSVLKGKSANGVWTLQINDNNVSHAGTLNQWSLTFQKPVPLTGLGESVADQATVGFQVFNWSNTSAQSQSSWTPIGPASENNNGSAGEVGSMAVDPSDPSGNTVYIGAAAGGVWKTTNFLTTSAQGPTWVPLTDTGPANAMNIGSIAVFGRNSDPNQSIILAGTGNADDGSAGVGMLLSTNGGATWTILDSLDNTVTTEAKRDQTFVGQRVIKVLVDPTPSPTNQVIMYAAVDGAKPGIYRSVDTGLHWTLFSNGIPAGAQPTDLVMQTTAKDPNSGAVRLFYAAFSSTGVYMSSNGGAWQLMAGGGGTLELRDATTNGTPVKITAGATPNTGTRIKLTVPDPTGNPLQDLFYQGWVYALVSNANGSFNGFYVTKDFGQNWTKVRIPVTVPYNSPGTPYEVAISPLITQAPTNNTGNPDYNLFGPQVNQGNFDIALTIDPNNPNVVYAGGYLDPYSLIRIDTTGIADAYNLSAFNSFQAGGAQLDFQQSSGGSIVRDFPNNPNFGLLSDLDQSFLNMTHNPLDPFNLNSTILLANTNTINNTGAVAPWTSIDFTGLQTDGNPTSNVHQLMTIVDPVTGQTRILVGNDVGIYSGVVDAGGGQDEGVSVNGLSGTGVADTNGSRNGNLQIAQLVEGAIQPSLAAADANGALFFASNYEEGALVAPKTLLTSGNLGWTATAVGSNSGNVAVDATGQTGQSYWYFHPADFPASGGPVPDYYQVGAKNFPPPATNNIGGVVRTTGLALNGVIWPNQDVGFAVNPLNASEMIIGSGGTATLGSPDVFRTDNTGFQWFTIGTTTTFGNTQIAALAYGAPQPSDPTGQLDNFIYAGTADGHIFVTFNGGGSWTNISAGLDGSNVEQIVTNPTHGSQEAYAVTNNGVFYMPNSQATGATWQKITGNLFSITFNPFNSGLTQPILKSLETMVVDWRYQIPNNANQPNGPTHPILYVGGNGGIFRSTDRGTTWTVFPNVANNGAAIDGGFLPTADITSLSLSDGNINPATGLPVPDNSTLNLLMATTYGRGAFAIAIPPPAAKPQSSTDVTLSVATFNGTDTLFNVTPDQALFEHTSSGWTKIGGSGTIESVSAVADSSGSVYAFVMTTDKSLFVFHNGWSLVGGAGTIAAISAGTDNAGHATVFAVTTTNALFEFDTASGWAQIGGSGTVLSVSATSHNTVVAVLTDHSVFAHSDQFGWFPLTSSGFGLQVAASFDGTGLVVNAMTVAHGLWQWHGSSGWNQIGGNGSIQSISSGLDLSGSANVFAITANNGMSEFDGARGWITLGGAGSILKVTAGQSDEVFAITADTSIFEHDDHFGWFRLSGPGFGHQ